MTQVARTQSPAQNGNPVCNWRSRVAKRKSVEGLCRCLRASRISLIPYRPLPNSGSQARRKPRTEAQTWRRKTKLVGVLSMFWISGGVYLRVELRTDATKVSMCNRWPSMPQLARRRKEIAPRSGLARTSRCMKCPPGSKFLTSRQWHGLELWGSHFVECPHGGLQHAERDWGEVVCLTAATVQVAQVPSIRAIDWTAHSCWRPARWQWM